MAPVATFVVSHRGVLPVHIKGSHSEWSFWKKGPRASLGLPRLPPSLNEALTLLLRSPSRRMFASPWRPGLSSPLLQPGVRDFGGLFYCAPFVRRCAGMLLEAV